MGAQKSEYQNMGDGRCPYFFLRPIFFFFLFHWRCAHNAAILFFSNAHILLFLYFMRAMPIMRPFYSLEGVDGHRQLFINLKKRFTFLYGTPTKTKNIMGEEPMVGPLY